MTAASTAQPMTDPLLVAPPLDPSVGDRAAPTVPAQVPAALLGPRSAVGSVPVGTGSGAGQGR
ncbi:hypothetical protein [Micromonospora sp. NPDC005189]|uniref:hypothetical protein n=1 Tax=unclassified Micromonospora TaxID=2617518 RepID=UPI0033A9E104